MEILIHKSCIVEGEHVVLKPKEKHVRKDVGRGTARYLVSNGLATYPGGANGRETGPLSTGGSAGALGAMSDAD